jgi:hypothetical protein
MLNEVGGLLDAWLAASTQSRNLGILGYWLLSRYDTGNPNLRRLQMNYNFRHGSI